MIFYFRQDITMQRFCLITGLSDHTLDNTTAIASVAMDATIIEKNFTINRNGGGADDSFSLEPQELAALCRDSRTAWEAVGNVDYGRKSSEQGNVKFRHSLYFVKSLKKDKVIQADAVRSVRPGYGLAEKFYEDILDKALLNNVFENAPIEPTDIDWFSK